LKIESSSFDVVGRNGEIIGEVPAAAGPFTGLTFSDVLVRVFGSDVGALNNEFDDKRSSNGDNSFNESDTYALTLDWELESGTFQSITALTELDYNELCDCDFTGSRVFDAKLQEQFEQFSQELRFTSDIGDTFDYILGAYYQSSDHDYSDQIIVESNSILVPAVNGRAPGAGNLISGTQAARVAKVESDVLSVFAQANWYLNEKWTLQVGGRFTREEKDGTRNMVIENSDGTPLSGAQIAAPVVFAQLFGITSSNLAALGPTGAFFQGQLGTIPVSGSRTEDIFSPDVKLRFEANDDLMLYLSYAKGEKSGGFDFRANNKGQSATLADSFEFDTETANSFELGAKYRSSNGRGELNATAFFTDFDDLQISIFDGILGFNVGNAASAKIKGLELDGRYAVSDNFMLTGAIALTDFEFKDFANGQCFFGATPDNGAFCSYTGNSQQMLSDVSAHFAADWNINIATGYYLNINGAVSYSSEYDASATYDPALVQDSFAKVDLRLALTPESERWELALLAKNIGDERTLNFGGDAPLAGSTFGLKSNYSYWAQGRTLTLQLGVNF
jgi:outer membrane receptor protein involved in Fe transport